MRPTQLVLADLEELSLDSRNTIVVFSNQSRRTMEEWFGHIDDLWLVAESGYTFKMGTKSEWKHLISLSNRVWLDGVLEVMLTFQENIDGAVVEKRETTVVFNYKNVEEEQGNMIAKKLYN